nr:ribose ABC transport system [Raoultella sp. NCTC 9187]
MKRTYFITPPEEQQREQGPDRYRDGIEPSAIFRFLYKWGMLLTVVLLIAVFGLASDNFLDPFNIINILRSIAIVTVIAIGVSISLTIGGFDLSVGSTASLANALVISLFVWHGFSTTEAILVTLALCTLVGLFNAF